MTGRREFLKTAALAGATLVVPMPRPLPGKNPRRLSEFGIFAYLSPSLVSKEVFVQAEDELRRAVILGMQQARFVPIEKARLAVTPAMKPFSNYTAMGMVVTARPAYFWERTERVHGLCERMEVEVPTCIR